MKKLLMAVMVMTIMAGSVYALGGGESSASAPADYLESGIASFNAGKFDQAIADFHKAIDQKKNVSEAYLGLAYAAAKKDDWEDVQTNIYMAICAIPSVDKAFNDKVEVEYADEFLKITADFEKKLKIDLSDIKEDLEMSTHFAMADVNRGLMMNSSDW